MKGGLSMCFCHFSGLVWLFPAQTELYKAHFSLPILQALSPNKQIDRWVVVWCYLQVRRKAQENSLVGKRQASSSSLSMTVLAPSLFLGCERCGSWKDQASWLYLLILTCLAPTVAAIGSDAQQEVGSNRSNGNHKAHKGNEEIIIQAQGQVASLEALLCQRKQRSTLHFGRLPAFCQLSIWNKRNLISQTCLALSRDLKRWAVSSSHPFYCSFLSDHIRNS